MLNAKMSNVIYYLFAIIIILFFLFFHGFFRKLGKGKCPQILNTKMSDKMSYANSEDPDQTAPERAV